MNGKFKQCELTRPVADGVARQVSWLPERLAVAGAVVDLRDDAAREWTAGWTVARVGALTLPAKVLEYPSRQPPHLAHASDN